jgi:hypothetical protein
MVLFLGNGISPVVLNRLSIPLSQQSRLAHFLARRFAGIPQHYQGHTH